MIKWLERNWFKILVSIIFIIGIVIVYQSCQDSADQEKMDANDKEISDLKKENKDLEGDVSEATQKAIKWEERAKKKEDLINARDLEINKLKEDLKKVPEIIEALPPSGVVSKMREILNCAQIELKDNGILFSEDCARIALNDLTSFSLVKKEIVLIEKSQVDCQDGWTFQKLATWNVYRIAWAQGSQIMRYKTIVKKQDENFSLLKKQKKRAWLNGLWKGFVGGVIVAAVIKLLRIL
ncbi:MAG: hypothetical protein KAR42_16930 [candidate division Zixibacteria bacterium]|nr:hypothetical protein [candidate division Zixibacteria bacterium]